MHVRDAFAEASAPPFRAVSIEHDDLAHSHGRDDLSGPIAIDISHGWSGVGDFTEVVLPDDITLPRE